MKLSCVVLTAVCATATIAAQVNSAPTATAEAPAIPSSNTVATQKSSPQDGNATALASGVWLMTWKNDKGDTRHATLHIQQKGEALSGTADVQSGPKDGTFRLTGNLRGNQIVLSVKVYWHHASFTGTVGGSKMSGITHDGRPWVATKS